MEKIRNQNGIFHNRLKNEERVRKHNLLLDPFRGFIGVFIDYYHESSKDSNDYLCYCGSIIFSKITFYIMKGITFYQLITLYLY